MDLRRQVIATWGELWESVPLHPRCVGEREHGGCQMRTVVLETSPGEQVPGFLLVPPQSQRNGKGVLCIHQHAGQWHLGKSEPVGLAGNPDMFYALELAQRGYTTFAIDLLAFEDRRPQPGDNLAHLDGSAYERFVAQELLMHGRTLKGRYVWDLHRALDFLAEQPGVASDRLGVIGHSLGGQSVVDIMLYDDRIAAGVCSCGIGTWATLLRDGINHNMAAYAPGLLQIADTDAMVAALAPRAFYMSAGTADRLFPIDGVRQIGAYASAAYAAAQAPERFHLQEFTGGHGFPADVREAAYAWLDRWLC